MVAAAQAAAASSWPPGTQEPAAYGAEEEAAVASSGPRRLPGHSPALCLLPLDLDGEDLRLREHLRRTRPGHHAQPGGQLKPCVAPNATSRAASGAASSGTSGEPAAPLGVPGELCELCGVKPVGVPCIALSGVPSPTSLSIAASYSASLATGVDPAS